VSKPTVTETIWAGGKLAQGRVELSLVAADAAVIQGYATGTNLAFLGTQYVELVDGVWSATLNPNVGTSTDVISLPGGSTGTRWKVTTRLDAMGPSQPPTVRYLKVPDTGSTIQAQDYVVPAPAAPRLVVEDSMASYASGATVTDSSFYTSGTFPFNGTSSGSNPSSIWECGTGGLYADHGWGWSNLPTFVGTTNHFRCTTRSFDVKHQMVTWTYKSAAYGVGGYSVTGTEAIDVWLRYITQFNLYALQFDRTDGRIYLKRKVPADASYVTAGGAGGLIANNGIYYIVKTDNQQPVFGVDSPYATWVGQSLSPPQHNATSTTGAQYEMAATIDTIGWSGGLPLVQVQLWRDGILVASWTDSNLGIDANSATLAAAVTAGYFTGTAGYQPTWYTPIDSHGGSGWRADNIQVWVKDFKLWDLDG
jgi:hypothetical protein